MNITQLKSAVSMTAICERYGITVNRQKFACCPFHSEDTASMRIYDSSFYCFGCGAGGDLITFVQKLFNLDFSGAVAKIDSDFSLGLTRPMKFSEYSKAKRAEQERKRIQAEQKRQEEYYWSLIAEYIRLDNNRRNFKPTSPDEELNPLFVEALQKIDAVEYALDCIPIGR